MSNIEVIRSHLDQAVSEIDYFLSCEKKWENGKRELVEFYNSMEAKNAASDESVIEEELSELTPEQDAALGWRTVDGETISDEQRNKVLADIAPSQPMSDEEWENLQDNLRGGWRKSADKAAEWLQKAGEIVAADAIREELNQLPEVLMLEEELISYWEAIRGKVKKVRRILVVCLEKTSQNGDETDKKTDRGKRIPPPEVNETIRYVVDQGVEIKKGKRPKASRKALISEHLKKDESSAEVKRMARQLQPDRYGWMLKNRQQTDK
jgi:hypothetical protein